jgi:hypothetical protein
VRVTGDIVSAYSDLRLKNIIGLIDKPLERIQNLNGVYYESNETAKRLGYQSTEKRIGFIAQDVEKSLPEAVSLAPIDINKFGHTISGEKYLTVQYYKLVPLLIEALKEQKKQIDYIKSKL